MNQVKINNKKDRKIIKVNQKNYLKKKKKA